MMIRQYFSFGVGQPLRKYYVVIDAESAEAARSLMVEQFGTCWSWQYSEAEWSANMARHSVDLARIGPLTEYDPSSVMMCDGNHAYPACAAPNCWQIYGAITDGSESSKGGQ